MFFFLCHSQHSLCFFLLFFFPYKKKKKKKKNFYKMDYYGNPYPGHFEYPAMPPHCGYGMPPPPPHMMWGPPEMMGPHGMVHPMEYQHQHHEYDVSVPVSAPCDDGYDLWAAAIATTTQDEEPSKIVHAIVADKKKKKKKKKSKKNKSNKRGRSLERESVDSDGISISRSASCDIETSSLSDEFPCHRRSCSLPPTETCLEGSLRMGGNQIHPMRRGLSRLF